ncbi:MAG: hypothetical protein IPM86_11015 [Saprospiraceae bacterium]|nr:hypothetical protein [Saprospiraceae bacterium]
MGKDPELVVEVSTGNTSGYNGQFGGSGGPSEGNYGSGGGGTSNNNPRINIRDIFGEYELKLITKAIDKLNNYFQVEFDIHQWLLLVDPDCLFEIAGLKQFSIDGIGELDCIQEYLKFRDSGLTGQEYTSLLNANELIKEVKSPIESVTPSRIMCTELITSIVPALDGVRYYCLIQNLAFTITDNNGVSHSFVTGNLQFMTNSPCTQATMPYCIAEAINEGVINAENKLKNPIGSEGSPQKDFLRGILNVFKKCIDAQCAIHQDSKIEANAALKGNDSDFKLNCGSQAKSIIFNQETFKPCK